MSVYGSGCSDSFTTHSTSSSIDNLQEIRTVAHLGDAPLHREDGHHLGRRKLSKGVVFREEDSRAGHKNPHRFTPTLPTFGDGASSTLGGGDLSNCDNQSYYSSRTADTNETAFSRKRWASVSQDGSGNLWKTSNVSPVAPPLNAIQNANAAVSTGEDATRYSLTSIAWKAIKATANVASSLVAKTQVVGAASRDLAIGFINDAIQERIQLWTLEQHLKKAKNYTQFKEIADKIDQIKMRDAWRLQNESNDYDWELIENRLTHLRNMRRQNDVATIAYTLRAGLLRNAGGIDNPRLYEVSYVHTKKLIEDYINTVVDQLLYVARSEVKEGGEGMSVEERLHFFLETRHAFGRTALLLSGGGGMAINHLGFVRTLMEEGLLPRVISGSSAGSIVGAVVACSTEEELKELLKPGNLEFRALAVKDFPNSASSLYRSISRLIRLGVLFDSEVLKQFVRKHIGDITFAQGFERTGRVLNVTVTSTKYAAGMKTGSEGSLLLNYLTAPNVVVWSAVVASCAIPGLFEAGELKALDKDGNMVPYHSACKSSWCDGSVACDIPAKRLSELFNINQHIVCQTNPWVVPFINSSDKSCKEYGWGVRGLWERAKYVAYSELKHRCQQGAEIGIIPSQLHWLVNFHFQSFTGDITLVPDVKLKDYLYVLQDPTVDHTEDCMTRSQKCTWPKVHLIRARCQIEQTLDVCVEQLRRKLRAGDEVPHKRRAGSNNTSRRSSSSNQHADSNSLTPLASTGLLSANGKPPAWRKSSRNESPGTAPGEGGRLQLGIPMINSLNDDHEIRGYSPPSRSSSRQFFGQ